MKVFRMIPSQILLRMKMFVANQYIRIQANPGALWKRQANRSGPDGRMLISVSSIGGPQPSSDGSKSNKRRPWTRRGSRTAESWRRLPALL